MNVETMRTIGGEGERHLAWRPTWPKGARDDFVTDAPDGAGYGRVRRVAGPTEAPRWRWSLDWRSVRRDGVAADFDDAVSSVETLFETIED